LLIHRVSNEESALIVPGAKAGGQQRHGVAALSDSFSFRFPGAQRLS
jgi:hypothetical protein